VTSCASRRQRSSGSSSRKNTDQRLSPLGRTATNQGVRNARDRLSAEPQPTRGSAERERSFRAPRARARRSRSASALATNS
jgi:hypothetical protein